MEQVSSCLVSVTLISFSLGSVFGAVPALGAILTKQEFEGDFTLTDSFSPLGGSFPDSSEYSGFVVYEEDGTLRDWEINVNELNLNLNPNSTQGDILNPAATVSFALSSPTNWNLEIDFGIALDASRYTLERMSGSEITFVGELGLAGGYVYTDSTANFVLSSSQTSVPEPATILGTILAIGAGASLLKRKRCA